MEWIKKHQFALSQIFIGITYSFSLSILISQYEDAPPYFLIIPLFLVAGLNIVFFRLLLKFLNDSHSPKEVFQEFGIVALTGISNIILFAGIYFSFGIDGGCDAPIKMDIANSLYFSIVTWTTLGYGDFKPIADLRLIAALEAFLGYVYMALFVGIFLNIVRVKVEYKKS